MKSYVLSVRAERSLDGIAAHSLERFGKRRGDRYVADLLERCQAVASGHVPHQSCRAHFADDLREGLLFVQAGRHFVIFMQAATQVFIIDFIHQNADIGDRLGGPPE